MPRISRRTLMASATALLAPFVMGAAARTAKRAAKQPNIVFFLADDLGYADVSCYGRPDIKTPNIDAIAARGVRFVQGYANSAVCSATRTALITGRYQYRLPVGLEEPIQIGGRSEHIGLPPSHPTLPSLLRQAGYGTTLLGKWHLGVLPDFSPLKSGYDHFFGFHGGALDYYNHQGTNHKDDLWDQDAPIHQTGYLTDLIGDRAVQAVDAYAKARKPFFLDVHFNAPHWPWEAEGDTAEAERMRTAALTDHDGGSQATYRKMVERMDMQIGRVLKALDRNGLTGDTIVIFTSDNGGERFADTWPFTGRKTELLEGGLRIPTVVCWPNGLPKGRVSQQVAVSMDWMPTLLAAAGTAPDPSFPPDGMNLFPIMKGQAPVVPRKLFWRYKANAQRALRDGDWKVLKIGDNSFLFNVADDPLERANMRDRRRDVFDRLTAQWDAWNAGMLPELRETPTDGFTAADYADHIGATKASLEPDLGGPWPLPKPAAPAG
jgi:arylsulfatase A-like enzyme